MICEFSVLTDDGYSVVIHDDKVCFMDDRGVNVLKESSNHCFNTLISLFSLKESWITCQCEYPVYRIKFSDYTGDKEFVFDYRTPANFSLFIGYVSRLVGKSI